MKLQMKSKLMPEDVAEIDEDAGEGVNPAAPHMVLY